MTEKKVVFPFVLLSLIFSLSAGLADIKYKNIFIPVLLIFVFTFVLGFFRPKYSLLWGIIVGLGIIVTHVFARVVDFQIPYEVQPNIFATLLALIPSFIGAFSGRFISKLRK